MSNYKESEERSGKSCDPELSRSEFLALVVKKSLLAGTLVAVPMIADAFTTPAQALPPPSGFIPP